MTQGELDRLRKSCFYLAGIQIRLPEEDITLLQHLPRLADPQGLSWDTGIPRVLRSWSTPEQGQFYSIKEILSSRSFLRSFALDSRQMMSNGGDNAEDKPASGAVYVVGDEGSLSSSSEVESDPRFYVKEDQPKKACPDGERRGAQESNHGGEGRQWDETFGISPKKKGQISELEGQVAKLRAREQHAVEELRRRIMMSLWKSLRKR
ncbi:hypothetical protein Acr_17g0005640 [Actinidia rufa]|uniref:Uncharacterized protein n=1 Tax=Actinidia rufa TaxID=165716 RepID=A0A7J0G2I8_9ERIC|nr:hypothetical protein Acr_17g0005640 [Actinidia rufa]